MAKTYANIKDNEIEPQKQYSITSHPSKGHKNGKHVI
jgi:hypothetical protein